MAGLKLISFGGFVPRVSPTLLQDNESTKAINAKLYSGSLDSWNRAAPVHPSVPVAADTTSIYKVVDSNGDDQWFAWSSDVDVVLGPITDTQAFRIYYTGDTNPRKTNATLAGTANGTAPDDYLSLGVPAPINAPAVSAAQPIKEVVITYGGTGYTSAPSVSFSGGGGSNAAATANINAEVVNIVIGNQGSSYTADPTVKIYGGGGVGAAATAKVDTTSGKVVSIEIVSKGTGYTSAPTVELSGGGGTGATASAQISGYVDKVTLTNGGTGYASLPTVSFSGGDGTGVTALASFGSLETRIYATTNISRFGDIYEESAPSPASGEVDVNDDATVTVSNLAIPATYSQSGTTITITKSAHGYSVGDLVTLDFTSGSAVDGKFPIATKPSGDSFTVEAAAAATTTGNVTIVLATPPGKYNIVARRIYRSVGGSQATSLQFVAEVPITTTSYADTLSSAELGEQLKTYTWTMPPDNMVGLIELPNGILAGFVDNEVRFCEPGYPHAWPVGYGTTVDHDIVGIASFGQSVAVMTKGNPYIISGVSPESMSSDKIAMVEPCISKRSIVSDSNGITYASPNGLVEFTPSGPQVITRNLMTREEFAIFSPASATAGATHGRYFMFYKSAPYEVENGCLIFDRNLPATPLTVSNFQANAVWVDKETSTMYIVWGGKILEWEGDPYNRLPYEWKSKEFILNSPVNFGAVEIHADFDAIGATATLNEIKAQVVADNQAIWDSGVELQSQFNAATLNTFQLNGSVMRTIPSDMDDRYVLFTVYADGQEVQRVQMTKRGVYRLKSGYKTDRYQFSVSGNIPLRHIKIAETAKELKAL